MPGVQAFDPTMRREVGGYDSPTPYLIKVTAKPVDEPEVTAKPAENTFISEPEPEKSGWDNFTNNTKKLVFNLGSQLPKFKLPKFKLPKFKLPKFKLPDFKLPDFKLPDFKLPDFKLPDFKLPSFGDVPGFDSMGGTYAKPIAPRKQQSQIDPPKSGLPSRTTAKPITKQSPPVPKFPNLLNLDPRIDTKFLQDVSKIAQSVGANPEDLLKVMLYETGGTLSPSIRNP
ncbi:MAG: hypothetical protein ACKPEQ_00905, partial [Dolichospermum sp.]